MFARLLAILMLALLALTPCPSSAQLAKKLLTQDAAATPMPPDPQTMEEVRDLVARLSDKEVRDLLLERLDTVAAEGETAPGAPLLDLLRDSAMGVAGAFTEAVEQLPRILVGFYDGFARFVADRGAGGTTAFLGVLALAILTGAAVENGLNRLADGWRRRILEERPENPAPDPRAAAPPGDPRFRRGRGFHLRRRLDGALADAAGAVQRRGGGGGDHPADPVRPSVRALARFVAAPRSAWLRLVNLDDRMAWFFYRSQIVIGVIIGLNALLIPFLATHDVPVREIRLFFWFNFIFYAYMIYVVLIAGGEKLDAIAPPDRGGNAEMVSQFLLVLAQFWKPPHTGSC